MLKLILFLSVASALPKFHSGDTVVVNKPTDIMAFFQTGRVGTVTNYLAKNEDCKNGYSYTVQFIGKHVIEDEICETNLSLGK